MSAAHPAPQTAPAILAEVKSLAPGAYQELEALERTAWASIEPLDLELCRLRIAATLGDTVGEAERTPAAIEAGLTEDLVSLLDRWWESDAFSARQKARLAYAEQFVVSVSSMEDDLIEALLVHDDHVRVYEFTMAIYVLDMKTRVALMTRAVLGTIGSEDAAK